MCIYGALTLLFKRFEFHWNVQSWPRNFARLLQGLFSVQNFHPFLLWNWRNRILEIKKYDSRIEEIWFSLKELQFSWSHIGGAISNFILLIVIDAERENIKLIKLKYFILFGIFCIALRRTGRMKIPYIRDLLKRSKMQEDI